MNDNPRPAKDDNDPIVAEVHAARQKLLEQYGGIEGYLRHARELDAQRHARARDLAEQREAEEAQASKSVTMRMPGKRVKRIRYIQTAKLIVAVGRRLNSASRRLTQDGTHVHFLPTRRDAAESPANRVARCQRFCEVDPTAFISIRTR